MLNFNVALCVLGFSVSIIYAQIAKDSGPLGQIIIHSIGSCDPNINDFHFEVSLNIDDHGLYTIDVDTEIPYDLDSDAEISIIGDKWVDDEWEKEKFKTSGKLFQLLNDHMPKIWTNIRNKIEPNLEESNGIKAGKYSLKGYHDIVENVELPSMLYGHFRYFIYIVKNEADIVCMTGEADSWE